MCLRIQEEPKMLIALFAKLKAYIKLALQKMYKPLYAIPIVYSVHTRVS